MQHYQVVKAGPRLQRGKSCNCIHRYSILPQSHDAPLHVTTVDRRRLQTTRVPLRVFNMASNFDAVQYLSQRLYFSIQRLSHKPRLNSFTSQESPFLISSPGCPTPFDSICCLGDVDVLHERMKICGATTGDLIDERRSVFTVR